MIGIPIYRNFVQPHQYQAVGSEGLSVIVIRQQGSISVYLYLSIPIIYKELEYMFNRDTYI